MFRKTDDIKNEFQIELKDVGMTPIAEKEVTAQQLLEQLNEGYSDAVVISEVTKSPTLMFQSVEVGGNEKRSLLLHILITGNYALKAGFFSIACAKDSIYEKYDSTIKAYSAAKSMKLFDIQMDDQQHSHETATRKLGI